MNIIAVTACPSGVAHTYMAAEALQKAAESRGHHIKVETQGSIGVENELTAAEIAAADAVVLTKDMPILREQRFKGKPVLKIGVQTAIKKAVQIVESLEQQLTPADH
ncbi:MAG TPA: PTS fructose-like transporter subunit IIB [Pseudonocardiaceae bacterium]